MLRKILLVPILALLILLFPNSVKAENEFSTTYDVTYQVEADGSTTVSQNVALKNLTSQYYATNYTLSISSTTVSDVTAADSAGPMETKISKEGTKTNINVKFNTAVAGIDKSQLFTLRFKSKDFAQNLGKTWEVNLPKIPSTGNIEVYNLVLSVPVSFGDPTSIAPTPVSQSQTFDRLFFTYNRDQLIKNGVSANFGTTQLFDFNIKYTLDNQSLFPTLSSVTLPPDTNYQEVVFNRLTPQPENVTQDVDGNYLAWYRIDRKSKLEVSLTGSAKLFIQPKDKSLQLLSKELIAKYTSPQKYWDTQSPQISGALEQIFKDGKPTTTKEKVGKIYDYVVSTLKYDTGRINDQNIIRLGALTALNNPNQAVCMEFTDLFIALTRAAGIPARELDGFAYTQNPTLRPLSLTKDLLHAWPEYYDDKRGWVMVDPTWENTSGGVDYFNKFDLNHFVLAIKGISSEYPFTSDQVKVEISETEVVGKPQLEVELDIPEQINAGFPANAIIRVINQGNSKAGAENLQITAGQLKVSGETQAKTPLVPAFGNYEHQIQLKSSNFWTSFTQPVEIEVAGQKFIRNIEVKPLWAFGNFQIFLAVSAGLILVAYFGLLTTHFLRYKPKSKK